MDLALRVDERLADGTRRLLVASYDDALARVRDPLADPWVTVHEVRKRLKEARAVLGLVRADLPRAWRRRERDALRGAARRVGAARDAAVLVATLDDLVARGVPAAGVAALRDDLMDARGRELARLLRDRALRAIDATLTACRQRVAHPDGPYPTGGLDPAPGLTRTYVRGRTARDLARETGTAHAFHAWRRQAKYLGYQLEMLGAFSGVGFGPAREIGSLLGDDHDLAVLVAHVGDTAPSVVDAAAARSAELRARALALGEAVYAPDPAAFVSAVLGTRPPS